MCIEILKEKYQIDWEQYARVKDQYHKMKNI